MKKKIPGPSEEQIQNAFIEWVRLSEPRYPALSLLFHSPNGGHRNLITAKRLKRLGVKPGVPDIILPVPRGVYCGLAIEFKKKGGKVSPEQSSFLDLLRVEGWYVNVAYDTETAISFVQAYLESPRRVTS